MVREVKRLHNHNPNFLLAYFSSSFLGGWLAVVLLFASWFLSLLVNEDVGFLSHTLEVLPIMIGPSEVGWWP